MHRAACAKLGPLPALRFKQDGLWHHLTWNDYRTTADDVAAGLIGLGVKPGDRVAILSDIAGNGWLPITRFFRRVLSTSRFMPPPHPRKSNISFSTVAHRASS